MLTDIEFNGRRLSEFGCMLCSFGNVGLETLSIGSQMSLNTITRNAVNEFELMSVKYDKPFERNFEICKKECSPNTTDRYFTDYEVVNLMRWLNIKGNRKFKMIYSDGKCANMYYFGTFDNIQIKSLGENILGFELHFQANTPFAYYEPLEYIMDFTDTSSIFVINDISDETGYIYPQYLQINILQDGDLKITNSQADESVEIKNCVADEIIILDGKNKIIQSNMEETSHTTLFNDFNYNFISIQNSLVDYVNDTENIFTVTLPCIINLKYSPVCKMGVVSAILR